MTATIEAHVAAVGAADADAVASVYGAEAELQDPAGTTVAVGRGAIREHFGRVLTEPGERHPRPPLAAAVGREQG